MKPVKQPLYILAWIIGLLLTSCAHPVTFPKAQNGVLDLSKTPPAPGVIQPLDGEWEVFPGKFAAPGDSLAPGRAQVPGYWNDQSSLPAFGYATYRLRLKLPQDLQVYGLRCPSVLTAYKLYIDGRLLAQVGSVGTTEETSRPGDGIRTVFFTPQHEYTEILIQISNFDYRKGGMWDSFRLGLEETILSGELTNRSSELFLIGALTVMALYHLGLFFMRPRDRTTLWFFLFCGVVILRFSVTGGNVLDQWLPDFDWEIRKKLEFLVFNFGCIPFMFFLQNLFPQEVNKKIQRVLVGIASLFGSVVLVTSVVFNNHLVVPMEVFVLLALGFYVYCLIRATYRGREGAWLVLLGLGIITGTALNDVLFSNQILATGYFMPLGFFVFMFLQAYILSMKFVGSLVREERLTETLVQTNQSLSRFLPSEFLSILQKENVVEVSLGDQVQKEMTVLFSDIRSFTALSETMTPEQTFNFLNSYFGRVSPLIRSNKGVVDKYIGDALMALFPHSPEDALKAAVALQQEMTRFNKDRAMAGYSGVHVGTGLHTGSLMLGTIGEKNRMDTTVISDAVNLASRLENLTKTYGRGTLFTMDFLDRLADPYAYHWRYMGVLRVSGRKEPLEVVHLYDGLPEEEFRAFDDTRKSFEEALGAYRSGDLVLARQGFLEVLSYNPSDSASLSYLEKIQIFLEKGVPLDWDGIEAPEKR